MAKNPRTRSKTALAAAVAGLLAAPLAMTSCSKNDTAAAAERNGCNGPNGCGGHGAKEKDTNGCSGPNGCNGHGTKEAEKPAAGK